MFHFKTSFLVSALLLVAHLAAASDSGSDSGSSSGFSDGFSQRAEKRESQRWTLQEWMAQKERIRWMDMWLSMNAPSPYEFSLEGSYKNYKTDVNNGTATGYTSSQASASAYAEFVGITAEYENNTQEGYNDLAGMFDLRLLGNSIQSSYLAIHYGVSTRTMSNPSDSLHQQFGQASLQMYVIKHFGFDGLYRYYMPTTDSTLGQVHETFTEAGAFIDFKNFRIFGTWYKEDQTSNPTSGATDTTRTGIRSGLKIFF